jgi:hypothetical protein
VSFHRQLPSIEIEKYSLLGYSRKFLVLCFVGRISASGEGAAELPKGCLADQNEPMDVVGPPASSKRRR